MFDVILLITYILSFATNVLGAEENVFKEELLIKPLHSGHVYSHFEFTTTWTNGEIANSIANYSDYCESILYLTFVIHIEIYIYV